VAKSGTCADSVVAHRRETSSRGNAECAVRKERARDGESSLRAGQGLGVEKNRWKAMRVGPLRPIVLREGERRLGQMSGSGAKAVVQLHSGSKMYE
jgi:hypothetical protein